MNGSEWFQIIAWWVVLAPPIAVSLSAVPLSIYAFVRDIWGGSSKILTALLLPGIILFSFGIAWFFAREGVRQTRRTIVASLERRQACRRCGYSLRGNVTGICPECGAAWRKKPARV
jgi:hypothetical protein